jgi:hypothetical protein
VALPPDPPNVAVLVEPAKAPPAKAVEPQDTPAPPPFQADAPRDLLVRLERDRGGLHVRVDRPGFIVSLRRSGARAVSDGSARIDVASGGTEETPIAWETTRRTTLETTGGTIRADAGGAPQVRVAEGPRSVAEDAKRGHRCRAHAEGTGGFAVVCRTGTILAARNLGSEAPQEGVTTWNHDGSFVRLDLEPAPGRPAAFVIAYTERDARVVIRAEASVVAGEDEPSIALVSAERDQPIATFVAVMAPPPHQRMRPDFDDIGF